MDTTEKSLFLTHISVICRQATRLCGYIAENRTFIIRNSCLLAPTVSHRHPPERRTAVLTFYTHNSHSSVARIVGSDRPNTERHHSVLAELFFLDETGLLAQSTEPVEELTTDT
jgi:hypothetical protein